MEGQRRVGLIPGQVCPEFKFSIKPVRLPTETATLESADLSHVDILGGELRND
jgi:hypothetical protein